jgi:hypothetical protein
VAPCSGPSRRHETRALTAPEDSSGEPLSRSEEGICAIQFEAVRQHNYGLRAALAFVHRETDRLVLVRERPPALALGVPDDPASKTVLTNEEHGPTPDAAWMFDW